MDGRWRSFAGFVALGAGLALIVGSFLPWEHSFASNVGASRHSGMDCVCGGELTVALGAILTGLGGVHLGEGRLWLSPFARPIVWVPTVFLSIVAGWLVTILWADVRDDPSTVAVGIGVFVMAAGAAAGLIGGILMRWPMSSSGDSRTLGWTLAITGGLTFGYLTFAYIHSFLTTGEFSLEAGILVPMGLPALGGLLALTAGIHILRANPTDGPAT